MRLALCLLLAATPAAADDCVDRIAAIVTDRSVDQPVEARIVTETKGQPTITNDFLIAEPGHTMFRPVDPAGMPWTLTVAGTMYNSTDGGESWTAVHSFDPDAQAAAEEAALAAQAETIANAVCDSEEVDGTTYDRLSAEMKMQGGFDVASTWWVDPATGFVARTESRMTGNGFDSFVTQEWQPAPGLTLPVPEG